MEDEGIGKRVRSKCEFRRKTPKQRPSRKVRTIAMKICLLQMFETAVVREMGCVARYSHVTGHCIPALSIPKGGREMRLFFGRNGKSRLTMAMSCGDTGANLDTSVQLRL